MGFRRAVDSNKPKLGQRIKKFFQGAGHTLGKLLQNPVVQALTIPLNFLGLPGIIASTAINVAGAGLGMVKAPNPDAISREENEDKMMAEAEANDILINRTQTSNVQRLYQACNVGSNLDNSDQYTRFETQGTRVEKVDDNILNVSNMYSSTNNRPMRTFQVKNSETKPADQFRIQDIKLSELQNIQNSDMQKNMHPSLGYYQPQSMIQF